MLFSFSLLFILLFMFQQQPPAPPSMPPEIKAEMDRMAHINELAPEGKIKTEADARRLVDELFWSMGLDKPEAALLFGRQIEELKTLVARAEFVAIRDHHRRLSEDKVAAAWNALMAEVGTPNWTRLSAAEIHYQRDGLATISKLQRGYHNPAIHVALISRLPDGSVDPNCRPTEAVYVLFMLQQIPMNFEALHKGAAEGILPSEKLRRLRDKEQREGKPTQTRAELRAFTDTAGEEYGRAWAHYFESHAYDRLPQRLLELTRDALNE